MIIVNISMHIGPSRSQKSLSFGYPGFVFYSTHDNPQLNPDLPFIVLIQPFGRWQLHLRNFNSMDNSCVSLHDLLSEISKFAHENGIDEIWGVNCTPGGISAISKLSNFGFKRVFIPPQCQSLTDSHWPTPDTEGGDLNLKRLSEWLANPRHANDFLVVCRGELVLPVLYLGEISYKNTVPRLFKMVFD